jgi:hypothetical protein
VLHTSLLRHRRDKAKVRVTCMLLHIMTVCVLARRRAVPVLCSHVVVLQIKTPTHSILCVMQCLMQWSAVVSVRPHAVACLRGWVASAIVRRLGLCGSSVHSDDGHSAQSDHATSETKQQLYSTSSRLSLSGTVSAAVRLDLRFVTARGLSSGALQARKLYWHCHLQL